MATHESIVAEGAASLTEIFLNDVDSEILVALAHVIHEEYGFSRRRTSELLSAAFGGEQVDYSNIVDKVGGFIEPPTRLNDVHRVISDTKFEEWLTSD